MENALSFDDGSYVLSPANAAVVFVTLAGFWVSFSVDDATPLSLVVREVFWVPTVNASSLHVSGLAPLHRDPDRLATSQYCTVESLVFVVVVGLVSEPQCLLAVSLRPLTVPLI